MAKSPIMENMTSHGMIIIKAWEIRKKKKLSAPFWREIEAENLFADSAFDHDRQQVFVLFSVFIHISEFRRHEEEKAN